jgi:hypothetical protein
MPIEVWHYDVRDDKIKRILQRHAQCLFAAGENFGCSVWTSAIPFSQKHCFLTRLRRSPVQPPEPELD